MILQTNPALGWTQVIFSAVLAVATVVLAWATWRYAVQSKQQTEEMKKSRLEMEKTRKADFRPVMKSTLENWTGIHHRFVIKNTGKGAAHDVTAQWGFKHLDYEAVWKNPLISPKDSHNFAFPFGETPELFKTLEQLERDLKDSSILYFEAEYTDPLGNKYDSYEEHTVLEIARSGAHIEMTQKDELQEIRKELKKIRKDARRLRKAVQKIQRSMRDNVNCLIDRLFGDDE